MLRFVVAVQAAVLSWRWSSEPRARGERGQATAEYALVLLGAAAVALVLVAWAAKSGKITALLDGVIDKVLSKL
jgi:hypothetical protein